eukprot:TRINITY_DN1834_c0_g1_i1.p1 TRINITY_DN1834_c0_g1~~TRINITY_DN1834_c0_g1_i1.p1  ORF type:complete len:582 (-),score=121.98 TRINITY_DN1834_c0_g1_i1:24-1577(-)
MEVSTLGWVGFGLGEPTSGSMPGGDIVTGEFDENGKGFVTDRFTLDFVKPSVDTCQDWIIVSSEQTDGKTIVEAKRKLVTDDTQDRPFNGGPLKVIYAYGTSNTFDYHKGNRGAQALTFFDPVPQPATNDMQTLDILFNHATPDPKRVTSYICQAFELPKVEGHIVRFDPVIVDHETVHHFQIHHCEPNVTDPSWQKFVESPRDCGTDRVMEMCESVIYAWAVGMGPLVLPEEAGFPIGSRRNDMKWIILETHYDNPHEKHINDTSGITLYYTDQKRKYDAAVMQFGDPVVSFPDIPPKEIVSFETECPSECTEKWDHPITVFNSFLHMHSIGYEMWTTHYRDDEFLQVENNIQFYDFNFQQNTKVNHTFMPGDKFYTHCVYNSNTRNEITRFGPASEDEMCIEFLAYYPALITKDDSTFTLCSSIHVGWCNGTDFCTLCGSRDILGSLMPNVPNPVTPDGHKVETIFGLEPESCPARPHSPIRVILLVCGVLTASVVVIVGVMMLIKRKKSYTFVQ